MPNGVTNEEYAYQEALALERQEDQAAAARAALFEEAKNRIKSRIKTQVKKQAVRTLARITAWVVVTIIIPALPFIAIGVIAILGGAFLLGILT